MEKKKEDRFEITELFMVKAGKKDWSRRFLGTIKREKDVNGNPILSGKVQVNDSVIYSQANNEEELGQRLDEMALLFVDGNLHGRIGKSTEVFGVDCFLN